MSVNLPPIPAGSDLLPVAAEPRNLQPYQRGAGGPAAPAEGGGSALITRTLAALQRYQWLVYACIIVAGGLGLLATRFIDPEFQVNAAVFANSREDGRGALGAGSLTGNAGWRDVIKSFNVIDPVVVQLSLYMRPQKAADSVLFANFGIDQTKRGYTPGDYTLKTEAGRYTLNDRLGFIHESGTVGDSVGRSAGFAWVPPARILGTKARTVKFKLMTPREASVDIRNRLQVDVLETSPIIALGLRGTAAQRPAATLNAMLTRFVAIADTLKKRELLQSATTIEAQLRAAQDKLTSTERQLEDYRVRVISQPSEASVLMPATSTGPVGSAGGFEVLRDPAFMTFEASKMEFENVRRDRTQLEEVLRTVKAGSTDSPANAVLSVPSVREPGGMALRSAVLQLDSAEASLRMARLSLKDSNPDVLRQQRYIAQLRPVVPQQLEAFVGNLRAREARLQRQLTDATRELQQIPQRTIQQGALMREQTVAADQYTRLRSAYAQANLAQLSAVPDVKVLDSAVTPLEPSTNTKPKLIGMSLAAGLGLGLALALLLDRLDSRFRYPDQIKNDLGLEVLGIVPAIDQSGRPQSPERVAQIVESFRSIRMNVRYAAGGSPHLALAITSPGPGDGKSLIASNLALSFAEGGWRTVLVDADTRRGVLNTTFDTPSSPGLVEYLEGTSLLSEVLAPTHHDNLTLVPCGTRHRRAPELIATPRFQQLVAALATEYDIVLIDTPPLGAGTDAYAVGTACGNVALVMRSSRTDIRMAKAKLAIIDQLPITVIGAIMNEVKTDSPIYQYYSYDAEYLLAEESEPALTSGRTEVAVSGRRG
jgi:polysaccharide biosynthesis transport protein